MRMSEIHDFARKLLETRGDGAAAEARRKALELEQKGESEEAENWRRIEAAIKEMRGPHES